MAHEPRTIEIDDDPTLLHFFADVRESGEALIVIHEGKEVGVVMSPDQFAREGLRPAGREKTDADLQAFLNAAGGWKGLVDTDKLVEDVYESRRISSRPSVEF